MADEQNLSKETKETKEKHKELKTLAFQGLLGAIALAGTTAIPLAITRILQTQTNSTPQPVQVAPAQIQPVNTNQNQLQNQVSKDEARKSKKKD